MASGSKDNTITIWDIRNGELVFTFDKSTGWHSLTVSTLTVLENGLLDSGSYDNTIKIWDTQLL